MTLVAALDYASVFVFALTGALVASRAQLDIVGFLFIAALTATGGGTVRDLILDRTVFWVAEPRYLIAAALAAVLVFVIAPRLESRLKTLIVLDALALAVAVPAGVAIAQGTGQGPAVIVIMGILTGCLGGLLRDVVCNEVPLVLKQGELYVTCAFAGALVALGARAVGLPEPPALILCGLTVLALRLGSLRFGWRLPVYRHGPPKDGPPRT